MYYSIHMCLEIINYTNMVEVQSNCALVVDKVSYSTHFPTMMYHTVHGALVTSNYASVGGAPEAYGSCRVCVC